MSEVKFDDKTQAQIERRFIWFAPRNVPYYQKDTEPKLFPNLYVKYVPLSLLEDSQVVIDGLEKKLLTYETTPAWPDHGLKTWPERAKELEAVVEAKDKEIQRLKKQLEAVGFGE